jgi:hypothetical protein
MATYQQKISGKYDQMSVEEVNEVISKLSEQINVENQSATPNGPALRVWGCNLSLAQAALAKKVASG